MLNTLSKSNHSGFSLIELMIGIAILAVLLLIAIPSFKMWIQNSAIRNAAESITNGLQRARAEAVARNANVSFSLGTDSSWSISLTSTTEILESRSSNEGSANITRTALPAGATTVTFNSFGGVANATPLTQVDLSAVSGSQSLRVTISTNGRVKMCYPSLDTGTSPLAC